MRLNMNSGLLLILMIAGGLSGCMSISQEAGFSDLQEDIASRTGYQVHWFSPDADSSIQHEIQMLLADTLTRDEAIQIALLNNRSLQSKYAAFGVAQADLVQAGLFQNPFLSAHVGYATEESHAPDLGFLVSFNFMDLFYVPLKKAVAASEFEVVKLLVAGDVLSLTNQVLQAYYDAQFAAQLFEMIGQSALSAEASYDVARLMYEAGNIPAVDLYEEQAFYERIRIELTQAQLGVVSSRERLNQLLGLWGDHIDWDVSSRLPSELEALPATDDAEKQVIAQSIDLQIIQQQTEVLGQQLGVINASRLLPALALGIGAEREGSWEVGPEIGFPLPIFDRGQARKGRSEALLREKQADYYAEAVHIRSVARTVREELIAAHNTVLQYRNMVLPLQMQISAETQKLFNAMQVGVFQLINARQREVTAGKMYLESLREYWRIKANYQLLLQGKMPGKEPVRTKGTLQLMPGSVNDGH